MPIAAPMVWAGPLWLAMAVAYWVMAFATPYRSADRLGSSLATDVPVRPITGSACAGHDAGSLDDAVAAPAHSALPLCSRAWLI